MTFFGPNKVKFWPEFYENRFPDRNWCIFSKNYDFLSFWSKLRDLEAKNKWKKQVNLGQKTRFGQKSLVFFTCFCSKSVDSGPISIFFFFHLKQYFQQLKPKIGQNFSIFRPENRLLLKNWLFFHFFGQI